MQHCYWTFRNDIHCMIRYSTLLNTCLLQEELIVSHQPHHHSEQVLSVCSPSHWPSTTRYWRNFSWVNTMYAHKVEYILMCLSLYIATCMLDNQVSNYTEVIISHNYIICTCIRRLLKTEHYMKSTLREQSLQLFLYFKVVPWWETFSNLCFHMYSNAMPN